MIYAAETELYLILLEIDTMEPNWCFSGMLGAALVWNPTTTNPNDPFFRITSIIMAQRETFFYCNQTLISYDQKSD